MSLGKVNTILDLIGQSPLIKINRLNPHPEVELFVKLETMNPGGSVKDRIGLSMIEAAEKKGLITPDKIILEASSGNTAIGLAMVCAVKGYRLLITMSESASEERKKILRAYGAEILLTPGHLSTDGAIEEAYRLAREEPDKYVLMDQFNNEANWQAHYHGTGLEIWEATAGNIDVVVITMGTTGTLMGTTRRLKELNPKIKIVGVEPFKGHKIQGLKNMKESYPPGIFEPSEPDAIVNVDDEQAYEMARKLAREEGILIGMSSGAALKIALDEAKQLQKGTVVALLPDGGERYLSTSLFVSEIVPEPLHFYNTLTNSIQDLRPVQPGKVGIYSCGPSLDGTSDLGLCRRLVFSDLLRRYLEYRGFEVKHVMNLGDIDDRTVNECLKNECSLQEFTAQWENQFHDDLKTLHILPAHLYPRASDHVNDMIEETRMLLDRGLAYEKLRSVYFNISQFPGYGKLSGFDLKATKSTSATVYDYYDKENPKDFALFKRSTLPELKAGIYWSTPWGNVRPSWHIECASLARRFLGRPFDIHTASTDLIFPHGDNEIAIAEGTGGPPLSKIWMHSEVVMFKGKKVNRASGNILTLQDLLEWGYDGPTIRFWFLTTHYRKVLKFNEEALKQAHQSIKRLNTFVTRLQSMEPQKSNPDLEQLIYETRSLFQAAMDHDLNIPKALGHLFTFIRTANSFITAGQMDAAQIKKTIDFMKDVNRVLAVIDLAAPVDEDNIDGLIQARTMAKSQGDYEKADALRQQLLGMGIKLYDTPSGTFWQKI
ncbi:cysteine--tRNA ligase [candidate division CSSED10-310 bacterium]|uniref:Cysteine--tRNA ligase n=1 Tax=candidate division CSSED10-310 bacterium TaxID=2855610 RepID=A0ABV6Z3R3_UNCC1